MIAHFPARLRKIRKSRKMSQEEVAEVLGISRRSYGLYELGRTLPGAGRLNELANFFHVSADWLLVGDGSFSEETASTKGIPIIGLASCSVEGWFHPQESTNLRTSLSAEDLPNAFAVTAAGTSLLPEGIKPGYICYCAPHALPVEGDIIYIKQKDNTVSLKVFREKTDEWLKVDGYFPPEKDGTQTKYTEKRPMTNIDTIAPVIFVKRRGAMV